MSWRWYLRRCLVTKVEKLRDELLRIERVPVVCDYEDPKVGRVHQITHRQIRAEQLDSLIAAAREEGEQIEKARHLDMNPEISLAALEAISTQTQRAHDFGVAEERERIRKAGIETDMLSDRYQQERAIVTPVSAFDSKESEK
jgi:predicted RNA-binding protein YlxR (DUF448 family)